MNEVNSTKEIDQSFENYYRKAALKFVAGVGAFVSAAVSIKFGIDACKIGLSGHDIENQSSVVLPLLVGGAATVACVQYYRHEN